MVPSHYGDDRDHRGGGHRADHPRGGLRLHRTDLTLVATLLNLLVWQLAALRQGPRPGVVTALATVVLDLVVLGVVIGLRLLVK